MRKEYDFSGGLPNPYAKKLRRQVSIRVDTDTVDYFKKRSEETGIPYRNLMNLYLADCATRSRNIDVSWK